jgi:hypothetical protein
MSGTIHDGGLDVGRGLGPSRAVVCQTAGHHLQEDTGGSSEGSPTKLSEHCFTFTFTFTFVTILLP